MSNDHEVRELRRRLKLAHQQLGKQGQEIYRLRCENTHLRAMTDPEDRHRMQQWLDGSDRASLVTEIESQQRVIKNLREQIDRRRAEEAEKHRNDDLRLHSRRGCF